MSVSDSGRSNADINAQAAQILAEVASQNTPTTAAALAAQLNVSIGPDVQSVGASIDGGVATVNITHTNGQGFTITATVNF